MRLKVESEPEKGNVRQDEKDHRKRTGTMDHTISLIRNLTMGIKKRENNW